MTDICMNNLLFLNSELSMPMMFVLTDRVVALSHCSGGAIVGVCPPERIQLLRCAMLKEVRMSLCLCTGAVQAVTCLGRTFNIGFAVLAIQ